MARTNYLKNAIKSVTFTAVDVLGELAPSIKEFADSNKDYIKQTYANIRTPKASARRRISGFMSSKVFEPIGYIWNNFFEDLKSGDFYNEKRHKKDTMKAMGFGDMLEGFDDFNFDDDMNVNNEEPSLDATITAGDTKIAGAVEGSVAAASMATVNAIVRSAEAQSKSARMNSAMLYEQNERLFNSLKVDLTHVGGTLTAMFDLQSQVLGNLDKNISKHQTESLRLDTERNEILKNWFEWQREQAKTAEEKQKAELEKQRKKNEGRRLSDIAFSGIPNVTAYMNNIKRKYAEAASLTNPFGDEASLTDVIKTQIGAAPIRTLMNQTMHFLIPRATKDLITSFDKAVKSIFPNLIYAINREAKNNYGLSGQIAEFLGLDTSYSNKINTSKYEKGKVDWDGKARKALIEVIPGYLSRIEAHLAGSGITLYDYDKGKWTTARQAKEDYANRRYDYAHSALYDISGDLNNAILASLRNRKYDVTDKKLQKEITEAKKQFALLYMDAVNNGLDFTIKKDRREHDDIKTITEEFKRYNDINETNKKELNKYAEVLIDAMRSLSPEKMIRTTMEMVNAGDMEKHDVESRQAAGDHIESMMEAYNKKFGIMDGTSGKMGLLGGRDNLGNTVFDYLQNINRELVWQHQNADIFNRIGVGGGRSRKPKPINSINLRNKGFFRSQRQLEAEERRRTSYDISDQDSIERQTMIKLINFVNDIGLQNGDLSDFDNGTLKYNADMMQALIGILGSSQDDAKLKDLFKRVGGIEIDDNTSRRISEFYERQFIKAKIDSASKIADAIDKAQEYAAEGINKKTYEVLTDKTFLGTVFEKLGLGNITKGIGNMMTGFNRGMESVVKNTNQWIYDLFFTTHVDEHGHKYNGFIEMLVAKTGSAFEKFTEKLNKDIIPSLKKALGLDQDEFSGRFKSALGGIFGGAWRRFADANRQMWFNPLMDYALSSPARNLVKYGMPWEYRKAMGRSSQKSLIDYTAAEKTAFAQEREDYLAKGDAGREEWLSKVGFYYLNNTTRKRNHLIGMGVDENIIDEWIAQKTGGDSSKIPWALDELYIQRSRELMSVQNESPEHMARGSFGRGYTGLSMLTKGEIVFGRGGVSVVPKTGAYWLNDDNVINTEDSNRLYRKFGFGTSEFKSVHNAEREENMVKKNLFLASHASGSGSLTDTLRDIGGYIKRGAASVGDDFTSGFSKAMRNPGFNATMTAIKQNVPELMAGGAVGAGVSLLLGLAGGPLVGAAVGAGSMLINRSKTLQDILFGKAGEDGERPGGVVPKQVIDAVKKYAPDMIDYGSMGLLGSLFLPFGPVGGMLIGSTIGFVKNNKAVRDALFGGLSFGLDKDTKETIAKMIPNTVRGAILGGVSTLFGGPFGFVGNALVGSAIGMLSSTSSFKDQILGYEDANGKRHGGILGVVKDAFQPLIEAGHEFKDRLIQSVNNNFISPIRRFLEPSINAVPQILAMIPRKFNDWFEKGFGVGFDTMFEKWFVGPMTSLFKPMAKLGGKLFEFATTPLRLLGASGDAIRRRQIQSRNAAYMTADERLAWAQENGVATNLDFDRRLASIGRRGGISFTEARGMRDSIQAMLDARTGLNNERAQANADVLRGLRGFTTADGEHIQATYITQIKDAIERGDVNTVQTIIANARLSRTKRYLTADEQKEVMEKLGVKQSITRFMDLNRRYEASKTLTGEKLSAESAKLKETLKSWGLENANLDPHELYKIMAYLDKELIRDPNANKTQEELNNRDNVKTQAVLDIRNLLIGAITGDNSYFKGLHVADIKEMEAADVTRNVITARNTIQSVQPVANIFGMFSGQDRSMLASGATSGKYNKITILLNKIKNARLSVAPEATSAFSSVKFTENMVNNLIRLFSNRDVVTVLQNIKAGSPITSDEFMVYEGLARDRVQFNRLASRCSRIVDANAYDQFSSLEAIMAMSGAELDNIVRRGVEPTSHARGTIGGIMRLARGVAGKIRSFARGTSTMGTDALDNFYTIAAGGVTGGLLSGSTGLTGLMGGIWGPIVGATVGSGLAFAMKSKNFQDWLFGSMDENNMRRNDGLFSQQFQAWFKRNIPGGVAGAGLGYMTSAMTGLGPIWGPVAGFAVGLLETNKDLRNELLGLIGVDANNPEELKAAAEKWTAAKFGGIGGAALGAMFGGPFGLLGNAAIGAGVGMISTSNMFKDAVFGAKDKYGKRTGGIVGGFKDALHDSFVRPIRSILRPLGQDIKDFGSWLGDNLKSGFKNTLSWTFKLIPESVRGGIHDFLHNTIGEPLKRFFKGGLFKTIGRGLFHGGIGGGIGALAGSMLGYGPALGWLLGTGASYIPKGLAAMGDLRSAYQADKFRANGRSASEMADIIERMRGEGNISQAYKYLRDVEHGDVDATAAKDFLAFREKYKRDSNSITGEDRKKYAAALKRMGLNKDQFGDERMMENLTEIVKGSINLNEAAKTSQDKALESLSEIAQKQSVDVETIRDMLKNTGREPIGVEVSDKTVERLANILKDIRDRQTAYANRIDLLNGLNEPEDNLARGTVRLKSLPRGTRIAHHFLGSLLGGGIGSMLSSLFGGDKSAADQPMIINNAQQTKSDNAPISTTQESFMGNTEKGLVRMWDSAHNLMMLVNPKTGKPVTSDDTTKQAVNAQERDVKQQSLMAKAQVATANVLDKAIGLGKKAGDGGWLTKLLMGGVLWKTGLLGKIWDGFKPIWTETIGPWFTEKALPAVGQTVSEALLGFGSWLGENLPAMIGGVFKGAWGIVKGFWKGLFGNKNNSGTQVDLDVDKMKQNPTQRAHLHNKAGIQFNNEEALQAMDRGEPVYNDSDEEVVYDKKTGKWSVKDKSPWWGNMASRLGKALPRAAVYKNTSMWLVNQMIKGGNWLEGALGKFGILGKFAGGAVNTGISAPAMLVQGVAKGAGSTTEAAKSTSWVAKFIDKVKQGVNQLMNSDFVQSAITKVYSWLHLDPAPVLARIKDRFAKGIVAGASNAATKTGEQAVKEATSKITLGPLWLIMVGVDFYNGISRARSMLGIRSVTPLDEIACGFINAVSQMFMLTLIWEPAEIATMIYEWVLPQEVLDKLKKEQKETAEWVEEMRTEYHVNWSPLELLERAYANAKDRATDWLSDVLFGNTTIANAHAEIANDMRVRGTNEAFGRREELLTAEKTYLDDVKFTTGEGANPVVENNFKWPNTSHKSDMEFMFEISLLTGSQRYAKFVEAIKYHRPNAVEDLVRASFITGRDFLTGDPLTQDRVNALTHLYKACVENSETLEHLAKYTDILTNYTGIESRVNRLDAEQRKSNNLKLEAEYKALEAKRIQDLNTRSAAANAPAVLNMPQGTRHGKHGRGRVLGWAKQNAPGMENIAYQTYGDSDFQSIADSGCGPAAAVNVLQYLGGARGTRRRGRYGRGIDPVSQSVVNASQYIANMGGKEIDGGTTPQGIQSYLASQGLGSKILSSGSKLASAVLSGRPTILMGLDGSSAAGGFDAWKYGFKMPGSTPYDKKIPHYISTYGLNEYGQLNVLDPESPFGMLSYDPATILNNSSLGIAVGKGTRRGHYGRGSQDDMALQVRNYLMSQGITPNGAYAILGNMQAESGIDPQKVQTNIWPYIKADEARKNVIKSSADYTKAVDSKDYSREQFITPYGNKRIGYGLVQYTFPAYKAALWERTVGAGKSIGDMRSQVDYLLHILSTEGGMKSLDAMLRDPNQTSVNVLTEQFLRKYERPANIDATLPTRLKFANDWVSKLAGKDGTYIPNAKAETLSSSSAESGPGNVLQQVFSAITNAVMGMITSQYSKYGLSDLNGSMSQISAGVTDSINNQYSQYGVPVVSSSTGDVAASASGPIDIGPGPFSVIVDPTQLTAHKGYITSKYGPRKPPKPGASNYHGGLDIIPEGYDRARRINHPIKIAADGVVEFAGQQNGYGNVVIVNHGHGFKTVYGHLNNLLDVQGNKIVAGQNVKAGQPLLQMGNSGVSTGAHLHFEVRKPSDPQAHGKNRTIDPHRGLAEMAKLFSTITPSTPSSVAPTNMAGMSQAEVVSESMYNAPGLQDQLNKQMYQQPQTIPSTPTSVAQMVNGNSAQLQVINQTHQMLSGAIGPAAKGTRRRRFGRSTMPMQMPGFGDMFGKVNGVLGSLTNGMPSSVGNLLGKLPMGNIQGKLANGIGQLTSKLPMGQIQSVLNGNLSGLTSKLPGGIGNLLSGLTSGKTPGFINSNNLLSGLTSTLGGSLPDIGSSLQGVMSGVTSKLGDLGNGITGSLGSMVSGMMGGSSAAPMTAQPSTTVVSNATDMTSTNDILMAIAKNTDNLNTMVKIMANGGTITPAAVANAQTPNTLAAQLQRSRSGAASSPQAAGMSNLQAQVDNADNKSVDRIRDMMHAIAAQ